MRTWTYSYKTSDGFSHEAEMEADCKDAVYDALRKRGIRAIKVTERIQPVVKGGFGGLRRRDWAAIACAILVPLAAAAVFVGRQRRPDVYADGDARKTAEVAPGDRVARPRPRRQITVADEDLDAIFSNPLDKFLARFVAPGRILDDDGAVPQEVEDDFIELLDGDVVIRAGDPAGVAELKGVVAGIKDEVRMLQSSGRSFPDIVAWLRERQVMEADYRKRLIERYVHDEAAANDQLRALGLEGTDR